MTAQTELKELERKIDLLSKALHLLLFEKKEKISKKEVNEIKRRLSAYLRGKKNQFVNLEDVLNIGSKNTQKGSKRA